MTRKKGGQRWWAHRSRDGRRVSEGGGRIGGERCEGKKAGPE